jgi:GTPase SAR1 family protein
MLRLVKNHFDQLLARTIKGKPLYFSTSDVLRSIGGFLVYDVSKKESFENATKWLYETENYANESMVIMLVGNKDDLE